MKKLLLILCCSFFIMAVKSQSVGIGTATPNASAQLDVTSTSKGLLIPRMTTAQRTAIAAPANGLMVYDTDFKEYHYFDGGSWRKFLNSNYDYWNKSATRNWVYNLTDSIGIGTSSPDEKFHLNSGNIYLQDNRTNKNPHVIFDVPAVDNNEGGLQWKRSGDTLAAINYIEDANLANYVRIGSGGAGKGNDLTINTSGEVGIGSANPLGQLHLAPYTGDNMVIRDVDGTIQFTKPPTIIGGSDEKKGFIQLTDTDDFRLGTNSANNTGKVIIRTNGTDHVTVDPTGEVGIGTPSPLAKLHIVGGGDAGTGFGNNGFIMLGETTGNASNMVIDNNEILARSGVVAGTLTLQNDGGNLSIGARTTINADAEALKINGVNPYIQIYQAGVAKSYIQQLGTDLKVGVNGGDLVLDGINVGVGTASPTSKLHVAGRGLFRGVGEVLAVDGTSNPNIGFYNNGTFKSFISQTPSELYIGVNNANLRLDAPQIVIGSGAPAIGYRLSIRGKIICEEMKVQLTGGWPDYVFDEAYKRPTLKELGNFIKANRHLPNIPPAAEIDKGGLNVGDMQKRMMEKIEELTLYILDQQKQIDELKAGQKK
jgi:hypothetical protein